MSYPPAGGPPDPYQSQQPSYDPTAYPAPYTPPTSGAPASGPGYGPPPGYPPPADGSPFGGPAQYGQPAYGSPYPTQVRATNTMAILALVFAFVFSPAAIVLGHIARKQIARTGEQGQGLATAGLIMGYVFTTLMVIYCLIVGAALIAGVSGNTASAY